MKKRVTIVGAADLLKELLCETLKARLGIECAVLPDLHSSVASLAEAEPVTRLVLLDDAEPNVDGALADVKLAASLQRVSLIVALYNVTPGGNAEREGLLRGVKGFFYRTDSVDLVCKGIRALFSGEVWVARDVLTRIAVENANGSRAVPGPAIQNASLTRREMEILSCIAVGWTNDQIATRLSVSSHTVKTHLYRIYKKIHVSGRLQAALWAANKL